MKTDDLENNRIINDIVSIIERTKHQIVVQANSSLTLMFWQIGERIRTEILQNKRAEYGKKIVVTLSRELVSRFGKNFEEKNLRRMIQFAERFPEFEKVVTLSRHLSWSHFLAIIPLKTEAERDFYSKLVCENPMGVRKLRKQISRKVYERIENANLQIIENKNIEQGIFKDPYLLDFLNLEAGYLENDLEQAILKELELFLLELGTGFTFVERQKRNAGRRKYSDRNNFMCRSK